ncbi:MAG: TIGR02186 family protein [Pseudomonadota bacterium]
MRLLAVILLWLAAVPSSAEEVVAALSQNRVAITTGFDGSEIIIYGAVKREKPAPDSGPLDVLVAVTGPSEPVIVRKKERRFGIWVNDQGVQVDAAPSLYAIASTRGFRQVISHTEDLRYKIGIDHVVRLIGDSFDEEYPEDYREAVIRLRKDQGLYFEQPGTVTVTEDTLFRTAIALPAQLVEGDYRARIFLLRDRAVVDVVEQTISVRKVGLERWIYTMAKEQSALYGIISIAVALAAGWLASAFFRVFFP